ncbi:glycosyl hydrolase 115 family protein [Pedobacter sp. P351]|uniref:glycosyl hydrolase 115 family protein n=1 Tax=Pedobacter superstes TaxID=3133441 RepID=UPI0030974AA4
MKIKLILTIAVLFLWNYSSAQPVATRVIGLPQYIEVLPSARGFEIAKNGNSATIYLDGNEWAGVIRAAGDLSDDIRKVSGIASRVVTGGSPAKGSIIVGTIGKSKLIDRLISDKKIDVSRIQGQWESYLIQTVGDNLIVAGSDKRGAIFGIYDISEKIGVSPWYWWADVPVLQNKTLVVKPGVYIQESPKVKYRGIFLNDEHPALANWVKNSFGTNYGNHKFYGHVFELILRLKANYLWPAMWAWAFYQDDPKNSELAKEMGVVIGTSHHEPMARNHQEWSRKRDEFGAWNYATNQKVIDDFFREGIVRIKGTEDIVTIGMRGDGDEPMSEESNVGLLESIVKNQRKIIEDVTKKPAKETPQVWALYKEVLDYYEAGMRVPDDVIMLLCDDNWGNVRRLPNEDERKHKGGWGMYYHVDYVGAPRNYKWLNVSPIQNIWEQMQLTYDYGVDKLWVLNVGDLKPMEYPITLFLDMAWDPERFTVESLLTHTRQFCAQQFGQSHSDEAMRILNLYSKYAGRVTPEMLDRNTYNLETGEWKQVSDEYLKLEVEALRQYMALEPQYRDAYKQIILFPVQAMANLYEMYYAQAMNHKLFADKNPAANFWAEKVEQTFGRDSLLTYDYNNVMSGGKWKHMMDQKHIGYTSWNDNFPKNIMPQVYRIKNAEEATGSYVFSADKGYVSIEAEHFYDRRNAPGAKWTIIPFMGRTLSGVAVMPYSKPTTNAAISYKMKLPKDVRSADVYIVVKSTLAFHDKSGHRYKVGFKGGSEQVINFNSDLNEDRKNVYTVFYPTVARRVVEKMVKLDIPATDDGAQLLTIAPLDPGIVFEKIVVDFGGYKKSYLFMEESPNKREGN